MQKIKKKNTTKSKEQTKRNSLKKYDKSERNIGEKNLRTKLNLKT